MLNSSYMNDGWMNEFILFFNFSVSHLPTPWRGWVGGGECGRWKINFCEWVMNQRWLPYLHSNWRNVPVIIISFYVHAFDEYSLTQYICCVQNARVIGYVMNMPQKKCQLYSKQISAVVRWVDMLYQNAISIPLTGHWVCPLEIFHFPLKFFPKFKE